VVEAPRRHGYWVAASLRQRSPVLTLAGGWDRYEAGLGHNLRRNVRRHRRRLEEHGLVRLDVHDGPDALDEVLTEAFRLEASGWKGDARSAIDARPATRRFYRDVARLAGDRGWLLLAALRLDGRAVAVDLCLEHAGLHHVVKTAYDESLASLSPGLLLRHEMIRRAFEHGLTRYELLGGTEPWKLAWTQEADDRLRVRALAPGLVTAPERFLRGSDAAPARWLRDRMADRQRDHSLRSGTHRA
jgi:CelD/BcsL family acetyltransferase involved in cellulose biosynthesis